MVSNLLKAVGVQPPFELIEVGSLRLAVKRTGTGTPVLCLHAIGHGGRDFEAFSALLAKDGFEVICLDWPGHGASPGTLEMPSVSAEHYASLLAAVVPLLCGNTRSIIIGNSIGGAAALSYASRYPDTVKGLVLCNPGGLAPSTGSADLFIAAMVAFFRAGARGARWFPRAFAAYYRGILPEPPAMLQRARIVAAGQETARLLAEAWDSFRQPDADLRAKAAGLQLPVLLAWAEQDRIVAWSRSKAAALTIPGVEVAMFRGGHSAFLEDPEAFYTRFVEFARALPTEPNTRSSKGV